MFSRWDAAVDSLQAAVVVGGALFVAALVIVPWRLSKEQELEKRGLAVRIKDLECRRITIDGYECGCACHDDEDQVPL
jgi:hypothetical protein